VRYVKLGLEQETKGTFDFENSVGYVANRCCLIALSNLNFVYDLRRQFFNAKASFCLS
jgi:hypothetical protein